MMMMMMMNDFSIESSSFIFNNLKRKNLSLPLKVETDQFVICLVLLIVCGSDQLESLSYFGHCAQFAFLHLCTLVCFCFFIAMYLNVEILFVNSAKI